MTAGARTGPRAVVPRRWQAATTAVILVLTAAAGLLGLGDATSRAGAAEREVEV